MQVQVHVHACAVGDGGAVNSPYVLCDSIGTVPLPFVACVPLQQFCSVRPICKTDQPSFLPLYSYCWLLQRLTRLLRCHASLLPGFQVGF